jgi:caffeoyl-CoA O-methyltransferase
VSFVVRNEIDRYAAEHTTSPTELLARLAEETRATLECPQMLTGPVEGRFLELLVSGTRAERVLEIGTYSGYSALSMAAGLAPGGTIDTCELEPRHAEVAKRYIAEAGYEDRIAVHVGPALETVQRLPGPWDFVFIDADKTGYRDYYETVLPKLSEHGLIAADNTLQNGRVVDDPAANTNTRAIVEFNEHVRNDERVVAVLLTIRDGVTLIRRR